MILLPVWFCRLHQRKNRQGEKCHQPVDQSLHLLRVHRPRSTGEPQPHTRAVSCLDGPVRVLLRDFEPENLSLRTQRSE